MGTLKELENKLKLLWNSKNKIRDIYSYLLGNYRMSLYYGKWSFLMRKHIKRQIEIRLNSTDKKCLSAGQCKICQCDIPGLQMANKSCDGHCYPKMLSKKIFNSLGNGGIHKEVIKENDEIVSDITWRLNEEQNKFIKYENFIYTKKMKEQGWVSTSINLGDIKQGTKKNVTFQYIGKNTGNPTMKGTCGCTTPVWNSANKTVTVTYKAAKLAPKVNEKRFTKTVSVTFPGDKLQTLTIFGNIKA